MIGIGFIGLLYDAHHAATDADTGTTDTQRRCTLAEPILTKLYTGSPQSVRSSSTSRRSRKL
jgi:hypothetical protein